MTLKTVGDVIDAMMKYPRSQPVCMAADPEGNEFHPFFQAELAATPDDFLLPRSVPRPPEVVILWPL